LGFWINNLGYNSIGHYLYNYPGGMYASIPSNKSKWYDINMGHVEIQILASIPTTHCMDLSNYEPSTFCQDVQLVANKKYEIQYSLYIIYIF